MNKGKKGKISINILISWLIGIFVVLIVIYIFPGKILPAIRDKALDLGYGVIPEEREPEFKGEKAVPKETEKKVDDFAKNLENLPGGDNCYVPIKDVFPELGKFRMELYNDKIQIVEENPRGESPADISKQLKNFKPCVVHAIHFFGFYLGPKEDRQKFKDEKKYEDSSLLIENDKISFKGKKYDFNKNILFKTDGRACFFLTHRTGSVWYNPLSWFQKYVCDASEYTLDNRCLNDITNKKILNSC